jgi:hypothetical protein
MVAFLTGRSNKPESGVPSLSISLDVKNLGSGREISSALAGQRELILRLDRAPLPTP